MPNTDTNQTNTSTAKKVIASDQKSKMDAVVKGLKDPNISDKMRALFAAGFSKADIARYLDKRYQHVRNVLNRPLKRKAS